MTARDRRCGVAFVGVVLAAMLLSAASPARADAPHVLATSRVVSRTGLTARAAGVVQRALRARPFGALRRLGSGLRRGAPSQARTAAPSAATSSATGAPAGAAMHAAGALEAGPSAGRITAMPSPGASGEPGWLHRAGGALTSAARRGVAGVRRVAARAGANRETIVRHAAVASMAVLTAAALPSDVAQMQHPALAVPLTAAALFLGDLLTGLEHITQDIGDMKWSIVREAWLHHRDPMGVTKASFVQNTGAVAKVTVPLALAAQALPLPPEAQFVVSASLAAATLGTQTHAWAHMAKANRPQWVSALQRARLLLTSREHSRHHAGRPPVQRRFEGSFGTLNGSSNVLTDAVINTVPGLRGFVERRTAENDRLYREWVKSPAR